jgi:transposase
MAQSPPPPMPSLNAGQREELQAQLRAHLPEGIYQTVEGLLRVLFWILQVLADKKTSLPRLHEVLFRSQNEKARKLFPPELPAATAPSAKKTKRKGHGRRKVSDYPGAKRVAVPHATLQAGQLCPQCRKGKLYLLKIPARLISILARPIFDATIHELERLRCALCGVLFTAQAPPSAAQGKYDSSTGTMLAILRYGAGLPMYRIEKWQACFGVPLPASTQWELLDQASALPELIYERLIELGAQGALVHNDDTSMRVQSLRRQIDTQEKGERTGIFTSSILCQSGAHAIALFFTGRQHAGENLDRLLKHRADTLDQPLQMCDALTRNRPKASATQECNCLLHGRRHFVEQIGNFPQECRQVVESIALIYQTEAQIKEAGLSPQQRLLAHQAQSRPVMDQLHQWMKTQLDQKQVEPNSGLGQAIQYMLNHWDGLTRFLNVPGAPIDNNICERALKMAILHRRNSLSYKTERGAKVGDVFMSLIHTCQLNRVNPFAYLTALQNHGEQVRQAPDLWLPWNYTQVMPTLESG